MTTDTYTIPGANVTAHIGCGPLGRSIVYELTATDGLARRYALGYDPAGYHVAAGGLVRVDGGDIVWLAHKSGDLVRVEVSGGECDVPVPRLAPIWRTYMPFVVIED